jgi:peptidoglycan/xylan/chitin deacetylase (PgdA/CDA1 family)
MRIVSPFLKRVLYPSLSAAGVFHRTSAPGLAVLTYHGVLPSGHETFDPALDGNLVTPEALRRQLRLLKANYNVIAPEDALAWRLHGGDLPPRAVLLTCDDGLLNNLTDMLPVLQQEGVRCLFFVTGASAGEERTTLWYEELLLLLLRAPEGRFEIASGPVVIRGELGAAKRRRALWWNSVKELSQVDATARSSLLSKLRSRFGLGSSLCLDESVPASLRRFGLLTAAELRQLAAGGMTIGAHTLSHPVLSEAPPALARAEVGDCRARLEAVLQQQIWAFAYPFGDAQSVTAQVLAMPKEYGYKAAFVNFGGGLGADLPPYALPRIHVTSEMGLGEFEAHVSGFHMRLQRLSGCASPVK